jgi:hypothetical protein
MGKKGPSLNKQRKQELYGPDIDARNSDKTLRDKLLQDSGLQDPIKKRRK